MALRFLSLLCALALCVANLQLRSYPPLLGASVSVTGTRTTPPRLTQMTVSTAAITPSAAHWSAQFVVIDCPDPCYVTVFLYNTASADTLPAHFLDGGVYANTNVRAYDGVANTSLPNGPTGNYSPWNPFENSFWANGQYFWAVQLEADSGIRSTIFGSAVQALGGVPLTLSGSTPVAAWATVDHFSFTPKSVNDAVTPITLSLHLALAPGVADPYVRVSFTKNSVIDLDYLRLNDYSNSGWFNYTLALNDWNVLYTIDQVRTGVRLPTVTAVGTDGQSLLSQDYNALNQRGLGGLLTLTGASFSNDEAPPNCNFTVDGSITTDDYVRVNAVCDETIGDSGVVVFPPTVTPPQRLDSGFDTSIEEIGEGTFLPGGSAPGSYQIDSLWVSDRSGNIALYSSRSPVITIGPLTNAFGNEETTQRVLKAYQTGEFTTTSGAPVQTGVCLMMVVLLVVMTMFVAADSDGGGSSSW